MHDLNIFWTELLPLTLSLTFSFVFFFLYLANKKDYSSLALMVFCLVVGWRNPLEGSLFSEWFPGFSPYLRLLIRKVIVGVVGGVGIISFIAPIAKFPKNLLFVFYGYASVLSIWIIVAPENKVANSINRFVLLGLFIFCLFKMGLNILKNNEKAFESKVFFLNILLLLFMSLGYVFSSINPGIVFSLFLLVFYSSHAFLLVRRFNKKKRN